MLANLFFIVVALNFCRQEIGSGRQQGQQYWQKCVLVMAMSSSVASRDNNTLRFFLCSARISESWYKFSWQCILVYCKELILDVIPDGTVNILKTIPTNKSTGPQFCCSCAALTEILAEMEVFLAPPVPRNSWFSNDCGLQLNDHCLSKNLF